MATTGCRSSSRANRTDSAPAMEPKRASTRSERQSPSRLSAGITSGLGIGFGQEPGVGRVDERGAVADVGMARRRGVHLLLEHALVDRGDRPLRAAVDARVDRGPPSGTRTPPRSGRSSARCARSATPVLPRRRVRPSAAPPPRRRRRPPCGPPRSGGPPTPAGRHPGMRRPVRTMTEPPTPSRRIRLGLPTSPVVSGVIVAALSPRPVSRMAAAASRTTALAVARRFSRERSKCTQLEVEPEDGRGPGRGGPRRATPVRSRRRRRR